MDDTINFAKENGYVETLMGRKRWLKDINSANFTVRGFAERNAINSPIQGTAADMIKLAMIKFIMNSASKISNQKCCCRCMMNWCLMHIRMKWKR